MAFSIGQIVEIVDTTGFLSGYPLQTSDRGTVIKEVDDLVHVVGLMEMTGCALILWHKRDRRPLFHSWMIADRLRLYVNPMDAPGRAKGSFETMQALRTVLQEEEAHAIEELRRELERARMTAEDLRSAAISPYRLLTWREFAIEQHNIVRSL